MPTCPNCGEIVMNGDPYCSNCGTIFGWGDDEDDDDSVSYGGRSSGYVLPSDGEILSSKAFIYKSYLNDARNEDNIERKIAKYRTAVDKANEYLDYAKICGLEPSAISGKSDILDGSDINECGRIYRDYLGKHAIFTDCEKLREDCRYVLNKSGNSHVIRQHDKAHEWEVAQKRKQMAIDNERRAVIYAREGYFENLQKAKTNVLKDSKSKAMKHYRKAMKCHEDYFNGNWRTFDLEKSKLMPKPPERLTEEALYYILILYQKTHPLLTSSKKDIIVNEEIAEILGLLHTAELIEADKNVREILAQKQLKRQRQVEKVEDVITDGIVGARILGDKLLGRFKK